jgi:DNA-directed RNA polymerase subunit L
LRIEPEVAGLPAPDGVAPSFARFEVADVDLSIVNSLRRAIMADVRTAAPVFDAAGGGAGHGTIRFVKNTSVLHNEFMGLRLSLVPIGFDENQLHGFRPDQYRFVLRAANAGDAVLNVTTADIRVLDAAGAALPDAERDRLFPPSPVSGDHVLLVRLKPRAQGAGALDGGTRGEELHVEFTAQLGSGSSRGAAFSPVSVCFFRNKVDPAAFERSLAERVARAKLQAADAEPGAEPGAAVDEAALRRQHAALDGQRDFVRDAHGEPAAFEFVLKSETRLRPTFIVFAGLRALVAKVKRLERGLARRADAGAGAGAEVAARDGEGVVDAAPVHVTAVPNVDDFYELAVHGEDHTLGNMTQAMLFKRWIRDGNSEDVSFIGYSQPHPQEDVIVFKIKLTHPGDDVRTRFAQGLAWLQTHLGALLDEWVRFSGLADVRDAKGNPLAAVAAAQRATLAQVVAATPASAAAATSPP